MQTPPPPAFAQHSAPSPQHYSDMWIRKEGAFTGVVPVATFMTAQEILAERRDEC